MSSVCVSPQPNNLFWNTLNGKRILVVGAGKTGESVVRFLHKQNADITVWDSRDNFAPSYDLKSKANTVVLGEHSNIEWSSVDGVVISPGVSPHIELLKPAFADNLPVIGDIELFALALGQLAQAPKIIGVTGSNGKTTVTLLIEHILRTAGMTVKALGNVGEPALDALEHLPDFLVLELSSFQLEMTASLILDVACYLNLSEDHLDRHGTMDAYGKAKQRIYLNSKCAVYWDDQNECHPEVDVPLLFSFSVTEDLSSKWRLLNNENVSLNGEPMISVKHSSLAGLHNILNIQAAVAASYKLGIGTQDIQRAIDTFEAPPHRCVTIANSKQVKWIDDSKATNPGATLAALEGIGPLVTGKLVLIAGGDGKGANLSVLADAVDKYVDTIIAIGKDAPAFTQFSSRTVIADTLDNAVEAASQIVEENDVVLLSPACASIDMFDNYIHRAQVFAESVQRWAA